MADDVLVQNIQTVISRLEAKLEKGAKNIKSVVGQDHYGTARKGRDNTGLIFSVNPQD